MVRLGQRLAIRIRSFNACVEPFAFLHQVGEEAQLAYRPADFTLAAGFG